MSVGLGASLASKASESKPFCSSRSRPSESKTTNAYCSFEPWIGCLGTGLGLFLGQQDHAAAKQNRFFARISLVEAEGGVRVRLDAHHSPAPIHKRNREQLEPEGQWRIAGIGKR